MRRSRPRAPLPSRDALAELAATPLTLAAEGTGGRAPPLVTIGIPTYRRADLLAQAVRSALAQDFAEPFEIVIVDNDPSSIDADALLARVPELREHAFRYLVNTRNIGVYPNHNRCIEQARAPWVTILNDDDLLRPDFLSISFRELNADPTINGLVGAKAWLDERVDKPASIATPSAAVRARALGRRAFMSLLYRRRFSRRITSRKLFWGPLAGNVCGFIFRRAGAVAIGGFDPDEEPAADLWFYIRFAQRFHLRQHRTVVADIRVAVNESLNPATIKAMFAKQHAIHQALAVGEVPRWWRHISPYLVARSRVELHGFWGIEVPADEVSKLIGKRLPGNRPYLIWPLKFLLRGF